MTYKYNPFWQQRIRETVRHALNVHPRLTALRVVRWVIARHGNICGSGLVMG